MTGWRCGWTLGPEALIAASSALQSHATSNASSITQKAVTAALNGIPGAGARDARRVPHAARSAARMADRRSARQVPQAGRRVLHVRRHQRRAGGRPASTTSTEFAEALLEDAKVAVTPGEAFGAPGFVRISYATSMDNLREGSRLMLEFVRARAASAGRR